MRSRVFFLSSLLLLTSCSWFGGDTTEVPEDDDRPITQNVSYEGTVEELGVTTYQEGTHRLTLDDGRFIALESDDASINLDMYLGQKVEVRGSSKPTVEGVGTIMNVTRITAMSDSSASSLAGEFCGGIAGLPCGDGFACVDDPTDSCDPMNGGADCGGVCIAMSSSSQSSSTSSSVSSMSSAATSSVVSVSSRPASSSVASTSSVTSMSSAAPDDLEATIMAMSKQNYSESSQWSQQYCTGHVGFCIPVHRNWYYKSFGATTSNLWHVEFGLADIENLGDGPIVLHVMPGTASAAGATDGEMKTSGSTVTGYKNWDDGTHIEIMADARLQAAVAYMLQHIEVHSDAQ